MEIKLECSRRNALQTGLAVGLSGLAMLATREEAYGQASPVDAVPEHVGDLIAHDPDSSLELVEEFAFGTTVYSVFEQTQNTAGDFAEGKSGGGEPIIVRRPTSGVPVLIQDFEGLPRVPMDTLDLTLFSLLANAAEARKTPSFSEAASAAQDKKILEAARKAAADGMKSDSAAGTRNGRLACAWAVNQIVEKALGLPLGGGLATANMVKVLRAKHVRVRIEDAPPGSIIISPTVCYPKANVGHVGILDSDGYIFSNSSSRARWERNFTVTSWTNYYRNKKGLAVEAYRLDEVYF